VKDAHDLVDALRAAGKYPDVLGSLFVDVRRDDFLPNRIWYRDADWKVVPVDREVAPEEWAAAVNSDGPIVTQWNDGEVEWPEAGDTPSSSASQPSAVAAMLVALGVETGDAVLDIGTGTGLNAGYTARQAGDDGRVSTVEIDENALTWASMALGRAGFASVKTVLGDGAFGDPQGAPFDRVISTMSMFAGRVPYAWVKQTRPGGVIVAPVRADMDSGPLVKFTVQEDGTATGRIQPMSVGFMISRTQRQSSVDDHDPRWLIAAEHVTTTQLDPAEVFRNEAVLWTVAMAVPHCRYNDDPGWWLRDPLTGSWATIDDNLTVRQRGPRRLWDEVTAAWYWWQDQGSPPLDAWEWIITPATQYITLAR
jgi:protein-L-isoaspartate O-methyltransferase